MERELGQQRAGDTGQSNAQTIGQDVNFLDVAVPRPQRNGVLGYGADLLPVVEYLRKANECNGDHDQDQEADQARSGAMVTGPSGM